METRHVGFEVCTLIVTKNTVFWDIMLFSALEVSWHVRGKYYLYLQGQRISRARNHLLSCCYLARLIFRPWRWRRYALPRCLLTLSRLHGVVSCKTVLFEPKHAGLNMNHSFIFVQKLKKNPFRHMVRMMMDDLGCWICANYIYKLLLKRFLFGLLCYSDYKTIKS
jgi:hypothetical protein